MENKEYLEEQELEIDLVALLLKIKSLWYLVVMGVLLGTFASLMYVGFFKVPYYASTSEVYIRSASKSISLQDLEIGQQLTNDYEIIFKSRPNLEKVIETLNLDMAATSLAGMISINNPEDTRILQVTVTSRDPNLSKDIANEVVNFGMDSIREIDSQEPYLIESAIANNAKVGSSVKTITLIGAMVGAMISMGLIFLKFILSDKIQSVNDVERTLDLPVLTVVSEDKNLSYFKKSNSKKHKKKKHRKKDDKK